MVITVAVEGTVITLLLEGVLVVMTGTLLAVVVAVVRVFKTGVPFSTSFLRI